MGSQSSPHDALFRGILGRPVNAASELRAVLPGTLVDRLDLDRLTRVPASFVDAALAWRHSDLLFTVPLQGQQAFVYVLVEHQSSEDPLMPFRMLRYVVRIWDHYLAERPRATRLPAVIPLVVHQNRTPWRSSTQLLDLLTLDPDTTEAVQELLPRFRFLLDDLTRLDERALRARPLTPPALITLLLLKSAPGNPRLVEVLRGWSGDLRAVLDRPGGLEEFAALLRYIELVGEVPTDQLRDLVATLGPEAEEAYVTTAEMLRAEGRAEGQARAVLEVLDARGVQVPESDRVRIATCTDPDQLTIWLRRALTATTIQDLDD